MKLFKNFTIEDLEELEESIEQKEKVYIELPKVPKVSLKNYKEIASEIREAITQSGISPDTWEDFLDYFDLKLKTKGRYSENTLDKALETFLRKRLGYRITDVWKEVIEAYKNITGKYIAPPPEIQNFLMKELEIQELMKIPEIDVVVVEKPVKQIVDPSGKNVKHRKSYKKKEIKKRLKRKRLKPKVFKTLIEKLKAKSKKIWIFYIGDGKKLTGIVVFYEKP